MSFLRISTIGGLCKKKRQYNPELLTAAKRDVTKKGISVYKAARIYGIPESTLRDRTLGLQPMTGSADLPAQGPAPLLSIKEEDQLVDHLTYMASIGYGYSRQEFKTLATDYAVSLGKKPASDPILSQSWYDGFKRRHPELTLAKPQKLSLVRAKCTSAEVLDKYFEQLNKVLTDNNIKDKPSNIWNVDETGLVLEHSPSNILCPKGYTPQSVTSNRGKTVTIIGSGNAAGIRLPPYYIFPGKRWNDDLLAGACSGSTGYMTESGWSNSLVFMDFMERHFKKFVPTNESPVLIILDGHRSHVNLTLKEWGMANNVVFFVLPPHTSHVTQPLDVGCFGALKRAYYSECQAFMRVNPGMQISRYNVAEISSSAYNKGLTPDNLVSSFRKTGIYPFRRDTIDDIKTAPAVIYTDNGAKNCDPCDGSCAFLKEKKITQVQEIEKKRKTPPAVEGNIMSPSKGSLLKKIAIEPATPKKKKQSKLIKPKVVKSASVKQPSENTSSSQKSIRCVAPGSPKPGTSGLSQIYISEDSQYSDDTDNDVSEANLCCVCNRYYAEDLNLNFIIEIVSWGVCSKCGHFTHLKFCSKTRVLRRNDVFLCPHCE